MSFPPNLKSCDPSGAGCPLWAPEAENVDLVEAGRDRECRSPISTSVPHPNILKMSRKLQRRN